MTEKLLLDINDSIGRIEAILLQQSESSTSTPTTTVDSAVIRATGKAKATGSIDPAQYDSVTGMLTAMSKISDNNSTALDSIATTMDKLTGIVKDLDLDRINETTDVISTLGGGLLGVGFKLTMAIPWLLSSRIAIPLVETLITRLGALPNITTDLSGTTELLEDVSNITTGLFKVGVGLTLLTPLLVTSIPGLILTGTVILPLLSLIATTSVASHPQFEGMQDSMRDLSVGMLYLAGTFTILTVMEKLIPVSTSAIATGYGLLVLTAGVMAGIGAIPDGVIESGVHSVKAMSVGLLIFGGSVAVLSLIGDAVQDSGTGVLTGLGLILLTGVTMAGVGLLDLHIKRGAGAVAIMGLSLLLFSASVALSSTVLMAIPGDASSGMVGVGLAIITFGTIFAVTGLVATNIAMGSGAIALMSLSLLAFGLVTAHIGQSWDTVPGDFLWQFPLFLVGVGVVYALAGYVAPFILAGAISFALIGGSMWIIGKGLESIISVTDTDPTVMDNLGLLLRGMVNSVGLAFEDVGVLDAVTLPAKLGLLVAMSGTMWMLAKGIRAWQSMALSPSTVQSIKNNMTAILTTIPSVFATVGQLDAGGSIKNPSVLSILGITDGFTKGDVERGIDATMDMGSNMIALAKGVESWKNMKISERDITKIRTNLVAVLSTIPSAFATIGQLEAGGSIYTPSVLSILGITDGFSKGDVERGIDSVSSLGNTLSSLAKGVESWKSMAISESDIRSINSNIQAVLLTIPSAFASVGKLNYDSTQFSPTVLSILGITDGFTTGHVESGIELVSSLSGTLSKLKDSIMIWKDPKLSPTALRPILDNVTTLLGILPTAFATIGSANENSKTTIGIFGVETTIGAGDIDRGVELVEDLITPMNKVAGVIKTMASISATPKDTIFGIGYGTYAFFNFTNKGIRMISKDTISKLNSIVTPMERLAKIFDKLNKGLKTHREYLKGIDTTTLKTWESWITVLDKVSKVNTTKLVETVTASVNYSKALATTPPESINTTVTNAVSSSTSSIGNVVKSAMDGIAGLFRSSTPTPKTTPTPSSNSNTTPRTTTVSTGGGGMDTATTQALLSAIEKLNALLERRTTL